MARNRFRAISLCRRAQMHKETAAPGTFEGTRIGSGGAVLAWR